MSEHNSYHPLLADVDAGGDYGLNDAEILAIQNDLADEPNLTEAMVDEACRAAMRSRVERAEYLLGDR